LALTGGLLGGAAGHFAGRAIPEEDLKQIAATLPPNSSGFLVLVEDTEAEAVANTLKSYNANIAPLPSAVRCSGVIESAVAADVTATSAEAGAKRIVKRWPPTSPTPTPGPTETTLIRPCVSVTTVDSL
jgi:hypothetical protein